MHHSVLAHRITFRSVVSMNVGAIRLDWKQRQILRDNCNATKQMNRRNGAVPDSKK